MNTESIYDFYLRVIIYDFGPRNNIKININPCLGLGLCREM